MRHTIIIAEAGVNHNGDLTLAKRLVDAAADAGADYIKFQTFRSEELVAKSAKMADYQKENLQAEDDSQLAMLKRLELSEADHRELISYAAERGIRFLSTAFDLASIDFLHSLQPDFWKVPSGEITNLPYLRKIAEKGGRVVMSTGMCAISDVLAAVEALTDAGVKRDDITLLHCNTQYPTPFADVNLRAMQHLADATGLSVGYSDHTVGIEVPIVAVALGACVIEKHITLDRTLPGPDQAASIEPDELRRMVAAIRNIEQALGSGVKEITASERPNIAAARKSIVAKRAIAKGELLSDSNLTAKRPGTGLSPMRWDEVVGTRAVRDFDEDELIEL
ncbi:MAG: N-acetylneuraminate synthase [Muribaculaceae bacterium]|nr:N-acetylneuraminate synthase [Muribaculaceae bacterium]